MTTAASLTAALTVYLTAGASSGPPAKDPCRLVSGLISAEAGRLVPTIKGLRIRGSGSSDGDLSGDVVLVVLKPFFGSDVTVEFTIADIAGPLVARGAAAFSADTSNADVFHIRSELQVTDDAGRGGAYRGSMTGTGQVDRRARTVAVAYTGLLCTHVPSRALTAAATTGGVR